MNTGLRQSYRGFRVDRRYVPGNGWAVRWRGPMPGDGGANEAGQWTAAQALAAAVDAIDRQYAAEADEVARRVMEATE